MSESRLSSQLALHVQKNRCDSLVLSDCWNQFVCGTGSEHRLSVFGKFKKSNHHEWPRYECTRILIRC